MGKPNILVNGLSNLPGKAKMAKDIVSAIVKSEDFELVPYSLTGADTTVSKMEVEGKQIRLYKPEQRIAFPDDVKSWSNPDVVIDFTHPDAVKGNIEFYTQNGWNFVMGTTGGDRSELESRVRNSGVVAIVAPNMGKQIVALQGAVQRFASENPGILKGYALVVTESHQAGKADTSGTAKAFVKYFNQLGIPYSEEQIVKIRDPAIQSAMGVPEWALGGHGWHDYEIFRGRRADPKGLIALNKAVVDAFLLKSFDKYKAGEETELTYEERFMSMTSPDKSVFFEAAFFDDVRLRVTHNVNGRGIYVAGVMDAARANVKLQNDSDARGKVKSMVDLLELGF